ncbi:MAG: NADH-quinone oxidoreductase subunit NuoF [Planctomycetota bacterium]
MTRTNFAEEAVLTKRIPSRPFGQDANRRVISIDEYLQTGGYESLKSAIQMQPSELVDLVKASELRGRGGAGFPTGLKWSFMQQPDPGSKPDFSMNGGVSGDREPRYLAINADESEPGTFKDRLLMDFDPHMMLEGIAICCYACQLDRAYIYIRGEYHHQAMVVENAIKEAYEKGIFGPNGLLSSATTATGHPFGVDVYLHRGAGAYICGEETGLLESLEGKRGWPRIKPPFPAVKGLFGKPTIINNVETLAALPSIIEKGIDWFKAHGVPGSAGTKLMGVSGHVVEPGVFEFDLGIPLRTIVEQYCGGMRHGKKFKGAIAGGVSTGILSADQYDAPMDFDIGRNYNVLGLGTACPTIFDEDTDMVAVARNIARFFKHESCGQCTPCREGSGWLYQLLSRIEDGDARSKDLDLTLEIATSMGAMPGTTICGLADGNNWAVRTILNKYRDEFEARVKPTFVPVTVGVAS